MSVTLTPRMRLAMKIYGEFNRTKHGKRRSYEFKEGVVSALQSAAMSTDTDFHPTWCPYKATTCQNDAWHAGSVEGRRLWRINEGAL
jgi:hypothetical protein